MSRSSLRTAAEVSPGQLHRFLETAFGATKAAFLERHGDWLHRGAENRLVALREGEVAGYCAVIPTRCQCGPSELPAYWWVDLWVAPRWRGQGLQTSFDEHIRGGDLKLGFPNRLAAKIHRKHGWGVREDFRSMVLPLRPERLRTVRKMSGLAGRGARVIAYGLAPLGRLAARRLADYRPISARPFEDPDVEELASLFERTRDAGLATTLRDSAFLRWRYFDAPYRDQLRFYRTGVERLPDHVLIAREVPVSGGVAVRILDVIGDLNDRFELVDLARLAVRHAVRQGAAQVTALSSHPVFSRALRRAGLLVSVPARFCWWSRDSRIQQRLGTLRQHWVMADSDNDEPVALSDEVTGE